MAENYPNLIRLAELMVRTPNGLANAASQETYRAWLATQTADQLAERARSAVADTVMWAADVDLPPPTVANVERWLGTLAPNVLGQLVGPWVVMVPPNWPWPNAPECTADVLEQLSLAVEG